MCCKKLAEAQPSSWKLIFLHYLKPVGGKVLLACDFDVKKLPIKLPEFYEECLKCFGEISVGSKMKNDQMSNGVASVIIWNNKNICVDGRSIYHSSLYKKGIVRLEDLVDDKNNLIVRKNLIQSVISPLEISVLLNEDY